METKGIMDLGEAGGVGERLGRERKQHLPAAMHQHITPVTSYTPHFIWNVVARQAEWYH